MNVHSQKVLLMPMRKTFDALKKSNFYDPPIKIFAVFEGRGTRGLLQPAELHRGDQCAVRAAAAWRDRQAGGGEAVRAGRSDVR